MNTGSTNPILFQVVLNPTLTNASFANVNAANSMAMVDTSATASSGGIVVMSGYVPAAASGRGDTGNTAWVQDLPLVTTALGGVQDTLSILCAGIGGVSSAVACINWKEVY